MPLRILIVEDNIDQAATIKAILENWTDPQFVAETVGSLKAALNRITISTQAFEHPELMLDCILLDLSLPDAKELEAVTAIAAISSTIGIVVLTGWGVDKAFELRAREAGANALLIKTHAEPREIVLEIRYAIWQKRDDQQQYKIENTLEQVEQMRKRFLQIRD